MDREKLLEMWTNAADAMRSGDFIGAIDEYKKALEYAPNEVMTYYGMGKVYFLMGSRNKTFDSYLIAFHLSAQAMKNHIKNKTQKGLVLQHQIAELPEVIKSAAIAVHPDAYLTYLDMNLPKHLGYAWILLYDSSALASELIAQGEEYKKALMGQDSNIDSAVDSEMFGKGAFYLVENIIWHRLNLENPAPLYNYYDIYRMVRGVVQQAEEETGVKVYDYEVMDFTNKEEQEWKMGWGIGLENPGAEYANVYVCYMAIEIDDMDNIIFPGQSSDSKDEKSDVHWKIAMTEKLFRKTMSDWDFEEILQGIVNTNVASVGAIKSDGKKYRTFKWISVRGYP
jgi:tetratricopeptide (TPR) repeat protein